MSKNQALAAAIVTGIVTILVLASGAVGCTLIMLLITGVFGLIWWLKYDRDARILQQAYASPLPLLSQAPAIPPMTSPGSTGLKVPAPLN